MKRVLVIWDSVKKYSPVHGRVTCNAVVEENSNLRRTRKPRGHAFACRMLGNSRELLICSEEIFSNYE